MHVAGAEICSESCADEASDLAETTLSWLVGLVLPPPMEPIASGGTSRKDCSRSCHWRSSSARCTNTRVFTPRRARIAAATTVFPKAVGACSTPMSWLPGVNYIGGSRHAI